MTGILSWIASGFAAALLARLVPRRKTRFGAEALAAVAGASLAGLAATALDFGGIATLDVRSATFAFAVAAAAVALIRLNRGSGRRPRASP